MAKITDPSKIRRLILLCAVVYFVSYITRINYAAVVSAYVAQEGISKELAALPITLQSISYGVGQLLSGYLGDRIPPKKIITFGLLLSTLMNFAMPLAGSIALMSTLWCINGFAQAMMWPPMMKITTSAFEESVFRKATLIISYGSSLGTVAVYLMGPALLSFSGWRSIFFVCGSCSALMIFFWNMGIRRAEANGLDIPLTPTQKKTGAKPVFSGNLLVFLPVIMLAIVCQGMIRDGVTTWMPSYVGDTYQLGSSVSILTGVVIPVFSIVSFKVAQLINQKWIPNEVTCAAVFAGLAAVSATVLAMASDSGALLSVLMSGIMVAAMCGVNMMLVCILPGAFSKFGNVSMVSGLLNFCTYVGSAVSSYTTASIASGFGWSMAIWSWAAISAVATILCIGCIRYWKNFKAN